MKRVHLIAPILIVVCHLLDDVEILIEDDVDGQELKAHGHFEFVLKRKGKRVCVVEAKKEKVEQGMSQNLFGTEVLSEVENLDYVFGIVTNYIEWIFFRNCEDRISISLQMESDGLPNADGLRKVIAQFYSVENVLLLRQETSVWKHESRSWIWMVPFFHSKAFF